MNLLIIVPKYNILAPDYYIYIIPTGLAYISSVLKQNDYIVDVLDMNNSSSTTKDKIIKNISEGNYLAVLTGGLSTHFKAVKDCVLLVKSISPETPVIVGGGLITSMPRLMFNELKADYVVIGEGEISIIELLGSIRKNTLLSGVDGIGYRNELGEIIITKERQVIRNLDELPYPDYEAFGLRNNIKSIKPSTLYYTNSLSYIKLI